MNLRLDQNKNLWMRAVAFSLAMALTLVSVPSVPAVLTSAGPISHIAASAIRIPEEFGTIKEHFEGRDGRVVVYIEDAHVNYGIQKNIAQILESLSEKYGLRLVGIEGVEGPLDMTLVKSFPDANVRREIMDEAVREGETTGTEFYASTTGHPVALTGVDHSRLYMTNTEQYIRLVSREKENVRLLADIRQALENLKPAYYSKENRELERIQTAFEKDRLEFATHLKYLYELSARIAISWASYPTLSLVYNATEKKTQTSEAELREVFSSVRTKDLVGELEELSSKLRTQLTQNENERFLINAVRYVSLLEKGASLELTRNETLGLQRLYRMFRKGKLISRITQLSSTSGIRISSFVIPAKAGIQKKWTPAFAGVTNMVDKLALDILEFYKTAAFRDKYFVERLKSESKQMREGLSALVTGGFHSEGILKSLKKQGISYLAITPKVVNALDSSKKENIYGRKMLGYAGILAPDVIARKAKARAKQSDTDVIASEAKRSTSTEIASPLTGLAMTDEANVRLMTMYAGLQVYGTDGSVDLERTIEIWTRQQIYRSRLVQRMVERSDKEVSSEWLKRLDETTSGDLVVLRSARNKIFVESASVVNETVRLFSNAKNLSSDQFYRGLAVRGDFIPYRPSLRGEVPSKGEAISDAGFGISINTEGPWPDESWKTFLQFLDNPILNLEPDEKGEYAGYIAHFLNEGGHSPFLQTFAFVEKYMGGGLALAILAQLKHAGAIKTIDDLKTFRELLLSTLEELDKVNPKGDSLKLWDILLVVHQSEILEYLYQYGGNISHHLGFYVRFIQKMREEQLSGIQINAALKRVLNAIETGIISMQLTPEQQTKILEVVAGQGYFDEMFYLGLLAELNQEKTDDTMKLFGSWPSDSWDMFDEYLSKPEFSVAHANFPYASVSYIDEKMTGLPQVAYAMSHLFIMERAYLFAYLQHVMDMGVIMMRPELKEYLKFFVEEISKFRNTLTPDSTEYQFLRLILDSSILRYVAKKGGDIKKHFRVYLSAAAVLAGHENGLKALAWGIQLVKDDAIHVKLDETDIKEMARHTTGKLYPESDKNPSVAEAAEEMTLNLILHLMGPAGLDEVNLSKETIAPPVEITATTSQAIKKTKVLGITEGPAQFSPDGKFLFVKTKNAQGDLDAKLIFTETGEDVSLHSDSPLDHFPVKDVTFSTDSKRMFIYYDAVTENKKNFGRVYDLNRREFIYVTKTTRFLESADISPDGKTLVERYEGGEIHLMDVETGKELALNSKPSSKVLGHFTGIKFSPIGSFMSAHYDNGSVRLFDMKSKQELKIGKNAQSIDYAVDDHRIVVLYKNRSASVFNVLRAKGAKVLKKVRPLGHLGTFPGALRLPGKVELASFSKDGSRLLVWVKEKQFAAVFDLNAGKTVWESPKGALLGNVVPIGYDRDYFKLEFEPGGVKLFHIPSSSYKEVAPDFIVNPLDIISPDGRFYINFSDSLDKPSTVYDFQTGDQFSIDSKLISLNEEFSDDGTLLFSKPEVSQWFYVLDMTNKGNIITNLTDIAGGKIMQAEFAAKTKLMFLRTENGNSLVVDLEQLLHHPESGTEKPPKTGVIPAKAGIQTPASAGVTNELEGSESDSEAEEEAPESFKVARTQARAEAIDLAMAVKIRYEYDPTIGETGAVFPTIYDVVVPEGDKAESNPKAQEIMQKFDRFESLNFEVLPLLNKQNKTVGVFYQLLAKMRQMLNTYEHLFKKREIDEPLESIAQNPSDLAGGRAVAQVFIRIENELKQALQTALPGAKSTDALPQSVEDLIQRFDGNKTSTLIGTPAEHYSQDQMDDISFAELLNIVHQKGNRNLTDAASGIEGGRRTLNVKIRRLSLQTVSEQAPPTGKTSPLPGRVYDDDGLLILEDLAKAEAAFEQAQDVDVDIANLKNMINEAFADKNPSLKDFVGTISKLLGKLEWYLSPKGAPHGTKAMVQTLYKDLKENNFDHAANHFNEFVQLALKLLQIIKNRGSSGLGSFIEKDEEDLIAFAKSKSSNSLDLMLFSIILKILAPKNTLQNTFKWLAVKEKYDELKNIFISIANTDPSSAKDKEIISGQLLVLQGDLKAWQKGVSGHKDAEEYIKALMNLREFLVYLLAQMPKLDEQQIALLKELVSGESDTAHDQLLLLRSLIKIPVKSKEYLIVLIGEMFKQPGAPAAEDMEEVRRKILRDYFKLIIADNTSEGTIEEIRTKLIKIASHTDPNTQESLTAYVFFLRTLIEVKKNLSEPAKKHLKEIAAGKFDGKLSDEKKQVISDMVRKTGMSSPESFVLLFEFIEDLFAPKSAEQISHAPNAAPSFDWHKALDQVPEYQHLKALFIKIADLGAHSEAYKQDILKELQLLAAHLPPMLAQTIPAQDMGTKALMQNLINLRELLTLLFDKFPDLPAESKTLLTEIVDGKFEGKHRSLVTFHAGTVGLSLPFEQAYGLADFIQEMFEPAIETKPAEPLSPEMLAKFAKIEITGLEGAKDEAPPIMAFEAEAYAKLIKSQVTADKLRTFMKQAESLGPQYKVVVQFELEKGQLHQIDPKILLFILTGNYTELKTAVSMFLVTAETDTWNKLPDNGWVHIYIIDTSKTATSIPSGTSMGGKTLTQKKMEALAGWKGLSVSGKTAAMSGGKSGGGVAGQPAASAGEAEINVHYLDARQEPTVEPPLAVRMVAEAFAKGQLIHRNKDLYNPESALVLADEKRVIIGMKLGSHSARIQFALMPVQEGGRVAVNYTDSGASFAPGSDIRIKALAIAFEAVGFKVHHEGYHLDAYFDKDSGANSIAELKDKVEFAIQVLSSIKDLDIHINAESGSIKRKEKPGIFKITNAPKNSVHNLRDNPNAPDIIGKTLAENMHLKRVNVEMTIQVIDYQNSTSTEIKYKLVKQVLPLVVIESSDQEQKRFLPTREQIESWAALLGIDLKGHSITQRALDWLSERQSLLLARGALTMMSDGSLQTNPDYESKKTASPINLFLTLIELGGDDGIRQMRREAAVAQALSPFTIKQVIGTLGTYQIERQVFPLVDDHLVFYVLKEAEKGTYHLAFPVFGEFPSGVETFIRILGRQKKNNIVNYEDIRRLLEAQNITTSAEYQEWVKAHTAKLGGESAVEAYSKSVFALLDVRNGREVLNQYIPAFDMNTLKAKAIRRETVSPVSFIGVRTSDGKALARVAMKFAGKGAENFKDKILIARYTEPEDDDGIKYSRGVVVTTGGVLSHAAIRSREHKKPALILNGAAFTEKGLQFRRFKGEEVAREFDFSGTPIKFLELSDYSEEEVTVKDGDLVYVDAVKGVFYVIANADDEATIRSYEAYHKWRVGVGFGALADKGSDELAAILKGIDNERLFKAVLDELIHKSLVPAAKLEAILSEVAADSGKKAAIVSFLRSRILEEIESFHQALAQNSGALTKTEDIEQVYLMADDLMKRSAQIEQMIQLANGDWSESGKAVGVKEAAENFLANAKKWLAAYQKTLTERVKQFKAEPTNGLMRLLRLSSQVGLAGLSLELLRPDLGELIKVLEQTRRDEVAAKIGRGVVWKQDLRDRLARPIAGGKGAHSGETVYVLETLKKAGVISEAVLNPEGFVIQPEEFKLWNEAGKPNDLDKELKKTLAIQYRDLVIRQAESFLEFMESDGRTSDMWKKMVRTSLQMGLASLKKTGDWDFDMDHIQFLTSHMRSIILQDIDHAERYNTITKGAHPITQSFVKRAQVLGAVAVRSSGLREDSHEEAMAGLRKSPLNVFGGLDEIYRSVLEVWKSGAEGVLIEEMINAKISGIAFSADPVEKRTDHIRITAAYGLAKGLVDHQVTNPDSYVISKTEADGEKYKIISSDIRGKEEEVILDLENGGTKLNTRASDFTPALDSDALKLVASTVDAISKYFGFQVDMEWSIDSTGRLVVLQVRPITTITEAIQSGRKHVLGEKPVAAGFGFHNDGRRPGILPGNSGARRPGYAEFRRGDRNSESIQTQLGSLVARWALRKDVGMVLPLSSRYPSVLRDVLLHSFGNELAVLQTLEGEKQAILSQIKSWNLSTLIISDAKYIDTLKQILADEEAGPLLKAKLVEVNQIVGLFKQINAGDVQILAETLRKELEISRRSGIYITDHARPITIDIKSTAISLLGEIPDNLRVSLGAGADNLVSGSSVMTELLDRFVELQKISALVSQAA